MSKDKTTDVHVIPGGDLKAHESSRNCWCKPEPDEDASNLFVHNPLDGRDRAWH